MKRLTALLCLGALVLLASDVGAQRFPYLTGKQLRWTDYAANVASTYRDTAYFTNADAPDTTDVLDMSEVVRFYPGADVAGTASALLRFMVTAQHFNVDTLYVGVDGAWSRFGPWTSASNEVSYSVVSSGVDAVGSANILVDLDLNTGDTPSEILARYPYVRFRFRSDAASGRALSGTRFYVYYPTADKTVPMRTFQQLRWANVAGEIGEGSSATGQYYSVTYTDTSSIYWPADTTSNTAAIDTTEAFDMAKITPLSYGMGAAATVYPITVGLSGTESGANCDSVAFYADIAPTPIGPWMETSNPFVAVRAGSDGLCAMNLWNLNTTAATNLIGTMLLNAPYVRFRVKMFSKSDAGGSGIRGARAFIGFNSAFVK